MCQMAWPVIKSRECAKFGALGLVFFSITYCFMCMLVKSNYSWFSKIQCFLTNDREGKQLIYMGGFIFSELPHGNLSKKPERNSAKRKQQEDPVFLCSSAVLAANTNIITFQSSIFRILKLCAEISSSKSICYQTWLCLLVAKLSVSWHLSKDADILYTDNNHKWWDLDFAVWPSNLGSHPNCLKCPLRSGFRSSTAVTDSLCLKYGLRTWTPSEFSQWYCCCYSGGHTLRITHEPFRSLVTPNNN